MAWERLKRLVRGKKEMPGGLWMRCERCKMLVYRRKVEERYRVCPECQYHFSLPSQERIQMLLDKDSFKEMWPDLESLDPLEFTARDSYVEKIKSSKEKSGLKDACVTGVGAIYGRPIALGITDSRFLMGSMGSVVGEKLTRLLEHARREKYPCVIVSGSGGGARMYEGAFSLMQMAKTSQALAKHHEAKQLFISVLTNPTMAGIMASFASLGDLIIAEPKALIGFTGPRVIEQTIRQKLPDGFQTSEFLLEHGMIDKIVHRKQLKNAIHQFLEYFPR